MGFTRERGNLYCDVKEKTQVANTMSSNTKAQCRGGVARSSDEASVMDVERRGYVVRSRALINLSRGMSS